MQDNQGEAAMGSRRKFFDEEYTLAGKERSDGAHSSNLESSGMNDESEDGSSKNPATLAKRGSKS
jgi:hypothetical protein